MIGWAVTCGMVAGFGGLLVVKGATTAPVRLSDALALLDRRPTVAAWQNESSTGTDPAHRWQRRLRLPLSVRQQELLLVQGRSAGDFFVEKLVWTLAGFFLPALWAAMQFALGNTVGTTPLLMTLLSAGVGYFVADVRLRSGAEQQRRSATDSIHTFFDLVVLERLANASGAQAAANAAAVSDAPLFRRIASGLERARMEQAPPWDELRLIAAEWNVPELADFADVMQMEDKGAGLADVLQARVRELRDAHLNHQKTQAQEASESMSLWMTIPALLLGVALLTPALLTLLSN